MRNTNTGTELCPDKLERCELAEEDEDNARSFEFQLRLHKKSLYLCPRRKSFNKTGVEITKVNESFVSIRNSSDVFDILSNCNSFYALKDNFKGTT